MSKFITSSETFDKIREAGLIEDDPTSIRRIVIDLKAGSIAKIYVEHFADDEKLGDLFAAGITVDSA